MLPNWNKRAKTTRAAAAEPQLTAEDVARIITEQMNSINSASKGCTYKHFTLYNPPNFDGTGGVVGIRKWLERMEVIFEISKCSDNNKVKYAASLFQDHAFTHWNTRVLTMGKEVANALTWVEFKNILLEKYCLMNEVEKLEAEYWNHTMVGTDIEAYTTRFHELTSMLPHMFPTEQERIERYIRGLIPEIKSFLITNGQTTLKKTINLARKLTDLVIASREQINEVSNNKRKQIAENCDRPIKIYQHQTIKNRKRTIQKQGTYVGDAPKCETCLLHHHGPCPICNQCGRSGHFKKHCRTGPKKPKTCYICGSLDHLRRDCPKLIPD